MNEVAREDARTAGALNGPKALVLDIVRLNKLVNALSFFHDAWEIVTDAPDASDWDMARGKVQAARLLVVDALEGLVKAEGK